MILRDYQSASVAATWDYLCGSAGNPVVVLPTGAGKSLVIAQLASDAVKRFGGRVVVLAHRKELLAQNADKMRRLVSDLPIGIYSAGLRSRDTESPVVLAGIQSAYQRALEFGERQLVIVDEVHLVPLAGEGQYRTFFDDLRRANPRMRAVGLTATPYRLGDGTICRADGLFQKIVYNAHVRTLIDQGWLCNLTSPKCDTTYDTAGLRKRGGEFIAGEVERVFDFHVGAACAEIVGRSRDRKSVLVFCSGVQHAVHVRETLASMTGESVGLVTGDSLPLERDATLSAFRRGDLRICCNVDVLTTGFDHESLDAIAILRATASPGLFAQICGRGLRKAEGKTDCLVLDFGGNIARHGPIDAICYEPKARKGIPGDAPTKQCPNCDAVLHASERTCDECGFEFPAKAVTHDGAPDEENPILAEPETWLVVEAHAYRHVKKKDAMAAPTMRVDYECVKSSGGNLTHTISEWVCFEHAGFARIKAVKWWRDRSIASVPTTVDEAVALHDCGAVAAPRSIVTVKEGWFNKIIRSDLDDRPTDWSDDGTSDPFASIVGEDDIPF